MLCVRTGASQPPADVDAVEHARRPEPEKTRETCIKNNARQQPCAFGHWCAARHFMVNASSGTVVAGLDAVVPFGNGCVSSATLHPLAPCLRSPKKKPEVKIRELIISGAANVGKVESDISFSKKQRDNPE